MSIKYLNHFIFINFLGFIDHRRFQEQSLTVFETLTDNVPPEMVVFRQVFLAVNVMVQVCPFASDPVVLTAPVKQNPPIQKTFCHDYDDVAYNREAPVLVFQVNFPLGSLMVLVSVSWVRCPTITLYTEVPDPALSRRWMVLPELTNHKSSVSESKE